MEAAFLSFAPRWPTHIHMHNTSNPDPKVGRTGRHTDLCPRVGGKEARCQYSSRVLGPYVSDNNR